MKASERQPILGDVRARPGIPNAASERNERVTMPDGVASASFEDESAMDRTCDTRVTKRRTISSLAAMSEAGKLSCVDRLSTYPLLGRHILDWKRPHFAFE